MSRSVDRSARSHFLHHRSLKDRAFKATVSQTAITIMTMPGHTLAGTVVPSSRTVWRDELVDTIKLALPIALTQLGQVAMMTSDLALLGRLGDQVVAASALAHTILFAAFVIGMGIVSAVSPLASQ